MKKFNKEKVVKSISEKLLNNFKVKFICFILAIIMYLTVSLFIQRETKTYSVKYKIENLKDYLIISNDLPDSVKIYAAEKPEIFDKITEEDFNVRLDLSKINEPAKANFKLKWDIPQTMQSFFSSIKIEPDEIFVEIDMKIEKNVKITVPNKIGKLANGFIEKKISIEPSFVRIQGPASIIKKINSVKTETINIEGVQESFRRQINLISDYPMIKILGRAEIFFEIVEETDVVTFRYSSILYQNLKPQFKAGIENNIVVKLTGAKKDIVNLSKNNVVLYIDCANVVLAGEYTYQVVVKKPDNVTLISINPEQVSVIIEDKL